VASSAVRLSGVSVDVEASDGKLLRILHAVDADFSRGTLTLVRGPSGSGKSTLLAVAGLLILPSNGEVYLHGCPMHDLSLADRRRQRLENVGFIFQDHRLIERLSALENILLAQSLRGRTDCSRAHSLLDTQGIGELASTQVRHLSGGQRQRVSVARTLSCDPSVLLCDEPTASLDNDSVHMIAGELRRLAKSEQRAVVVATHDERLELYADTVLMLFDGNVTGFHTRAAWESSHAA
jgi:putative ABC transport system ATP-binding protein